MLISVHEYELLQSRLARALKVVDAVREHRVAQANFQGAIGRRQTFGATLRDYAAAVNVRQSVTVAYEKIGVALKEHDEAGESFGTITVIHDSVEVDVNLAALPEGTYRIVKG